MISIRNISKRYGAGSGSILAVDGVSLEVNAGEVLGFLGPNGAGKSTTMKMVTGFLTPTSGSAVVCGRDVVDDPVGVKSVIGYLPEGAPNYPDMTPSAFLDFIGRIRGFSGAEKKRRIEAVVERVHIGGVMKQPIETLSKGFKRRVGLAQAMLHEPPVLILDEPTDGLDPNQKHEVRNVIRELAGRGDVHSGRAVVLSTHILEEVEAVCTRAVIIAKGKVLVDGTPAQLRAMSKYHNAVTITVIPPLSAAGEPVNVAKDFAAITWVADVEDQGVRHVPVSAAGPAGPRQTCTLVPKGGRPLLADVASFAKGKGWTIETIAVEGGRLDDVFREMTTRDLARESRPKATAGGAA
ncbi:MAG: ABC transporter ATP-binding protein [Phycisphaerae bacterium]|nr:ABC transporter ATP-binding protein [Phycisphaerae bacterium]